MPPSTPLCFCDRPVVIKETRGIEFTCRNASIVFEGVRKCTWGLPTEKIAFPKPQYVLHRRVTEEQFRTRWDEITQKYRKQSKEKRKAMEEAILSGKSWPLKSTPETPKPIKMIVPTSVMLNKNSHYNSQT
ncbi:hypothetical protein BY458DRAFT_506457 [Sporodiniella umbellata]|nr:hypothetical protein BY458DRAFT_506457 [Sporodiniella umbellata]